MEYHVSCQCGKRIPVKAEDAGTTIGCECGQSVRVPSLSKLRTMSGVGAYESGAIDTIQRMLAEGALPWGETCAESGRPTRDLIHLVIQCERLHLPQDQHKLALLGVLIFGWVAALVAFAGKDREAHGRDTSICIPLRLDREYHGKLARWGSQRKLRRLLRTVPVYGRLLEEYPRATIRVESSWIDPKGDATWAELESPTI
jgi:hypothetical protein